MRLIVEITTKDDKTKKYECVDFPYMGSDFITLYLPNFTRSIIKTEAVAEVKQYFQCQKK